MKLLDIGEVARASGMPASALRYYEEKGLIAPVGRHGLRRLYTVDVLDRLALVALGQAAGFSLDEIAVVFRADGSIAIDRPQLRAKADELDRTIQRLVAMRDGLLHAAECRAQSHMECPTFRRLMGAARDGAFANHASTAPVRKASRKRPAPTRSRK